MPYMLLHCNNVKCKYNKEKELLCGATDVHYVNRLCLTFKRRPDTVNYTELMKSSEPKGYKRNGKWIRN